MSNRTKTRRRSNVENQIESIFLKKFIAVEKSWLLESRQGADADGGEKLFDVFLVFDELGGRVSHPGVELLPHVRHQEDENDGADERHDDFGEGEKVTARLRSWLLFHFVNVESLNLFVI
jgi:hypothetical protein